MDNKDIIRKVLDSADNFQNKSAEELRAMLDKELSKPDNETDYALVDELTTAIIEAEGNQRLTVNIDEEFSKLQEKTAVHGRTFHFPKWAVGVSAACVMLVCANFVSVAALNKNIISAVIEFTKGGFSVDFNKPDNNTADMPISEQDPFGIVAECAKYNIYSETPYYLPEGFELDGIETNINKDYANTVSFRFINGDKSICMDFTRFWNDVGQIGIPSDNFNISEIEVNGYPAIISKEDNQYTITYQKDKTVFFMFTQDVPYEECEKIVESIK